MRLEEDNSNEKIIDNLKNENQQLLIKNKEMSDSIKSYAVRYSNMNKTVIFLSVITILSLIILSVVGFASFKNSKDKEIKISDQQKITDEQKNKLTDNEKEIVEKSDAINQMQNKIYENERIITELQNKNAELQETINNQKELIEIYKAKSEQKSEPQTQTETAGGIYEER